MTSRDPIGTYMRTLASRLGQLDKADAEEVMREIEGHIRDVVEQAQARGKPPTSTPCCKASARPRHWPPRTWPTSAPARRHRPASA